MRATPGLLPLLRLKLEKAFFASGCLIAILVAVKEPWPMGLRVVFGLVVLGLTVSMGQVAFYGVMGRGLFAEEVGGAWAIPSAAMSYVAIMMGGFRLRRPFIFVVTALCVYSIPLTAFLNWPMLQTFWQDILSSRMTLARIQSWETWCFIWNNICLSIDAGILLYLGSYEFRLFGPGKIRAEAS